MFEPNSIIGKSNKLLLKFSNKIFCYDENLKGIEKKYFEKIISLPPILDKCFYLKKNTSFNKDNILKILILGGSQASLFFTKKFKKKIFQLSSKYKIEVTLQLNKDFEIKKYKKDY